MKHLLLLFISTFLCINVAIGQRNEPIITRSFPMTSIQAVEIHAQNGDIIVIGDDNSPVTVEVFVTNPVLSSSRIKELFEENHTIDIREENGKLTVAAKARRLSPGLWNRRNNPNRLNVSFRISVPSNISSDLRTSNGSIHISNLSGDAQNFRTSNGFLLVENVSGNIIGRTSNGRINLENSQGNIDLTTSNGRISAQNSSGTITVKTSNGRINLNDLIGIIAARTSNSRITANNIQGTLETRTSNGSVTLNRLSGNVTASTSNGSMNVEMLSVTDFVRLSANRDINLVMPDKNYSISVQGNRIRTSGLRDFSGNMDLRRRLNGNIGNGGAEINARGKRVNLNFR
jgi:DUF4097 and DUF4098 domain-containing protein YvlB